MQIIISILNFFQDQVLGMKWLNAVIGSGLSAVGLDLESKVGASIQFFIYDTIKITVLLCVLIYLYFLYPKLLSAGAQQTDIRAFSWSRCKYCRRLAWNGYSVLFMFFYTAVSSALQAPVFLWA